MSQVGLSSLIVDQAEMDDVDTTSASSSMLSPWSEENLGQSSTRSGLPKGRRLTRSNTSNFSQNFKRKRASMLANFMDDEEATERQNETFWELLKGCFFGKKVSS